MLTDSRKGSCYNSRYGNKYLQQQVDEWKFSFIGPDEYNKDLSGMTGNKRMRTFISPDSGRREQLYLQHSLYCVLFGPTQTFRPKRMLKVIILYRMKGTPNNVLNLQRSVGRIQPIRLSRPCVMCVRGPKNVRRSVQRIQHCCATLWRSRNQRMLVVVGLKV